MKKKFKRLLFYLIVNLIWSGIFIYGFMHITVYR